MQQPKLVENAAPELVENAAPGWRGAFASRTPSREAHRLIGARQRMPTPGHVLALRVSARGRPSQVAHFVRDGRGPPSRTSGELHIQGNLTFGNTHFEEIPPSETLTFGIPT